MSRPNTDTADEETRQRALEGPHCGWDTFDIGLEGARFHRLHEIVASATFDAAAAAAVLDELEALAQGMGYGDADSHIAAAGQNDTVREIRRAMIFDDPGASDYFSEVGVSERILLKACATDAARQSIFNGDAPSIRMLEAYGRGAEMRTSQEKDNALQGVGP